MDFIPWAYPSRRSNQIIFSEGIDEEGYRLDQVKKLAKELRRQGRKLIAPREDELFIDIDTNAQYRQFLKMYDSLLSRDYECQIIANHPSKSGEPHRHIIIKIRKAFSLQQKIVLQAILGSDPVREYLSLQRVINDAPYYSLLAVDMDFPRQEIDLTLYD